MGIEGGSSNNEIQNQEINQSTNEQIEQNQAEHQRSGEELEGNSTIDNEGERKQIEGKDDATESSEGESLQLDKDDSIENDTGQEQPVENEVTSPEQQKLDNQDTIEGDTTSADGMSENDQEITDSLDGEDSIDDEDVSETDDIEEVEDTEKSLDQDDSIENDDSNDGDDAEEVTEDSDGSLDSEDFIEGEDNTETDGENAEDTEEDSENAEYTEADGNSVDSKELNETNNYYYFKNVDNSDGPRNPVGSDANDFRGSSLNTASGAETPDWKNTKDIVNAASDAGHDITGVIDKVKNGEKITPEEKQNLMDAADGLRKVGNDDAANAVSHLYEPTEKALNDEGNEYNGAETQTIEGDSKNVEDAEADGETTDSNDVKDYSDKIKESFSGDAREAQAEFNDFMRNNMWNDASLSNQEKVDIMKSNFDNMTPEQQENFNVIGDARIISNDDYSDWGEGKGKNYWPEVDWPDFPGLNGESTDNPPRGCVDSSTGDVQIPDHVDRLGSPGGNNLGIVEDGHHCSQDERSIAYVENPNARNDYSFKGDHYKEAIDAVKDFDLGNPQESMDRLNDVIRANNETNGTNLPMLDSNNPDDVGKVLVMHDSYNKFQNDCHNFCEKYGCDSTYGLIGEAKAWDVNGERVCNGGAGQVNTPINVASLERLGIVVNNGGW